MSVSIQRIAALVAAGVTVSVSAAATPAAAQIIGYEQFLSVPGTLPDGTPYVPEGEQVALYSMGAYNGQSVGFFAPGTTITPSGTPIGGLTRLYMADAATPDDLTRIASIGDAVPNRPGFEFINFAGFTGPTLVDTNTSAFYGIGTLGGGAVSTPDQLVNGYYGYVDGGLTEIISRGMAFPSRDGGTNGTFTGGSASGLLSTGDAALFRASNMNGTTDEEALFRWTPTDGLSRVVGTGGVLDIGSPRGSINILDLVNVSGGNDGASALTAEVQTESGSIWTNITFVDFGEGLTPLVSPNDFGIGLFDAYEGAQFPMAVDDSGFAFGRKEYPLSPTELYVYDRATEEFRRAVARGDAIGPDGNELVYLGLNSGDVLLDDGVLMFYGEYGPEGATRGTGTIFLDNGTGPVALLSQGDEFDGKTISGLSLSPNGFDDGQFLLNVGFSDQTAGMYLVTIPEPTGAAGLLAAGAALGLRRRSSQRA